MNTGYWLPQGSILHEKYSIKKGLGQRRGSVRKHLCERIGVV